MQEHLSATPASRTGLAGSQVRPPSPVAQIPTVDTAASFLRNVLQILEFASEASEASRLVYRFASGDVLLRRGQANDVRNLIGLAIADSEQPAMIDPAQLDLAVERTVKALRAEMLKDFTPKQLAFDPPGVLIVEDDATGAA